MNVNELFTETSVFGYLYSEVTRGYMLEHDEAKFTEKRKRVYTFMKIPRELEKVPSSTANFVERAKFAMVLYKMYVYRQHNHQY